MAIPIELQNVLSKKGGIVTTAQANTVGISNERLSLLVRQGKLDRVTHGVYIVPDEFVDMMYILQQQRTKLIFSHETALFLHELTDRDPINYSVTVPTGYNANNLRKDGLTVYTVKSELHEIGIIQKDTMFGHSINTYNLERTICDCIRSRNKMDIAIVTDAMKNYVKRNDKNLIVLNRMAKAFRITKILQNYLEVLL